MSFWLYVDFEKCVTFVKECLSKKGYEIFGSMWTLKSVHEKEVEI